MKKQQLLTLSISSILLVACGGGTSATLTHPLNHSLKTYPVPSSSKAEITRTKSYTLSKDYKDAVIYKGKRYVTGDTVDLSKNAPLGYFEENERIDIGGNEKNAQIHNKLKVYNLPYSLTFGEIPETIAGAEQSDGSRIKRDYTEKEKNQLFTTYSWGVHTKKLPAITTAEYKGIAFGVSDTGTFNLSANFTTRRANGKIVMADPAKNITLNEGLIVNLPKEQVWGFAGDATVPAPPKGLPTDNKYRYVGIFYGPNAEEVGGRVKHVEKLNPKDDDEPTVMGFAGQRTDL